MNVCMNHFISYFDLKIWIGVSLNYYFLKFHYIALILVCLIKSLCTCSFIKYIFLFASRFAMIF